MDKPTLEKKRQACAEAKKAFEDAIKEYQAGKPEGHEVSAEEWREKASEKLRAAREDFTKLSNELIAEEQLAKDTTDLEKWDDYFKKPVNRLPVHDAHDADIDEPPEPGTRKERFQNELEREAFSLQQAITHGTAPKTQLNVNLMNSFKNLGKEFRRLNLKEEQKEAHREFFSAYIRHGENDGKTINARERLREVVPRETFALLTSSGETGGFWVPEDFQSQVIRDLPGFSIFRQIARVERTGRDTFVFPTIKAPTQANSVKGYPARFSGSWKAQRTTSGGKANLTTQDQPTFEQERIQVWRWEPDAVELSMELLEDPAANVESVLAEIIAETKGIDENSAFTSGDGNGQPLGITAESLTAVNSGASGGLKFNPGSNKGLLGLVGKLPAQYRMNASFMMNSLTYTTALGVENSSTGHNLVFPQPSQSMISGSPLGSLMGYRVAFNEFMADLAANSYSIIFGDFRYYVIVDRTELRVMRLVERAAPNVAFLPIARLGGQVVRTNAFVRQKAAT